MNPGMLQQIHIVIETGLDTKEVLLMAPMTGPYPIPQDKSYRDERAIARVLREVADEFDKGMGFRGWVAPVGSLDQLPEADAGPQAG